MTEVRGPIAYFSMEIAADEDVPTYSGGLGVLAGDQLRAAADLGLPMVGITLLYHGGYFRQELGPAGEQLEHAVVWDPADHLERLPVDIDLPLGEQRVRVGAWRLWIEGARGHRVPVVFLDTDDEANHPDDRLVTDRLYHGSPALRLRQEAVLGLGGMAVLGAVGQDPAVTHMNEGHAALAPLGLSGGGGDLADHLADLGPQDLDDLRRRCVFTTHTPVAAGHDRFPAAVVEEVLGAAVAKELVRLGAYDGHELNMTSLAAFFSGRVNVVSRRHAEVTRPMLGGRDVGSVTNGVHHLTWAAPATRDLLDGHVDGWRRDPALLRYALTIPLDEVRAAHRLNKDRLLDVVRDRSGEDLDPDALTLCVARRAAAYKRTDLLLADPHVLARVAAVGPLQILYAGKAHPADEEGKGAIGEIVERAGRLAGTARVVYLADYDMRLARLLCAGSDLWVNTPLPPYEASGTSGMKAALNAVPSLSTLDGWWPEGHLEGVTGWAIDADGGVDSGDGGDHHGSEASALADPRVRAADATALYRTLQEVVAPLFHHDPEAFAAVGRGAMAVNGSFFNAQRMVQEYVEAAYLDVGPPSSPANRSS